MEIVQRIEAERSTRELSQADPRVRMGTQILYRYIYIYIYIYIYYNYKHKHPFVEDEREKQSSTCHRPENAQKTNQGGRGKIWLGGALLREEPSDYNILYNILYYSI